MATKRESYGRWFCKALLPLISRPGARSKVNMPVESNMQSSKPRVQKKEKTCRATRTEYGLCKNPSTRCQRRRIPHLNWQIVRTAALQPLRSCLRSSNTVVVALLIYSSCHHSSIGTRTALSPHLVAGRHPLRRTLAHLTCRLRPQSHLRG
jgi:hypothetical protein